MQTQVARQPAAAERRPEPFTSNPIRLSWREWAAAALLCLAAVALLPAIYPAVGRHFSQADYRLPSELASDYWMFRNWARYSRARFPAVVLGDSVVWGQYAKDDDTLSHHLSAGLGARTFANLGVDGLHPAAMEGLVSSYGDALTGKPVLLLLNPLWMTSPEQDLQGRGEREARFNHPELVAQVWHRPPSYRPAASEVAGVIVERETPFLSWKKHLQIAYCDGLALTEWTLENPYAAPKDRGPDTFSGADPGSPPETWQERGLAAQDFPWVPAGRSYQWQAFRRTVEVLRARRNRVFVLVGPFNTHALTPASRARYEALARAMTQRLAQERVPYYAPPALPTDLYADASHPLGAGYRALAGQLLAVPSFRKWLAG